MAFVHLHVHSEFSLLQSVAKINDLVEEASRRKDEALALTDIDAMHGVVPFYKACVAKGIKPIIGVELAVSFNDAAVEQRTELGRLLFIARNDEGYKALLKLTSRARTREESYINYVTLQEIEKDLSGAIIISPFENGHIQMLIENGKGEEAVSLFQKLRHIAGTENVYIEIQNHWRRQERERLLAIRDWVDKQQVPVVATNHVHFMNKDQMEAHKVLQAIRSGELLAELPDDITSEEYYLKTEQEMAEALPSWKEALSETGRIAERCNLKLTLGEPVLPRFPVPERTTSKSFLQELCEKGLHERYANPDQAVKERLEYELQVISEMDYEDYFLIVADFMDYAHRKEILTGPGRGSAAGSIVAYVLKITDVDPLKYDLLFERFLNPERISMPDIDIDFSDHQRDEVIQYVSRKYGRGHVAQIVTFGTLAAKAAVRDAGRALDIKLAKIDKIAKQIPGRPNIRLQQAVEGNSSLQAQIKEDNELKNLFNIAMTIEGLPRHTSIHAAGVVISQEPLTNVVPLQQGHEGLFLTQYPMGALEDIGLLKMDFLGLRNLTFIERLLNLVHESTGETVPVRRLPVDDKKTFELLGRGDTSGVFQLESSGMRDVLRNLKPTLFEDIVAVNALYRPGPMANIPSYINRKHGAEKVSYPHPDLESILKPTYGVIIYQEQIMKIAARMAGFSLGEADVLRRAVSKKKRDELEKARKQFVGGSQAKGYSAAEAERVYDLIVRFADYGFPRTHAVAYSMISYQLAYLKAHHPLVFMQGLMDMAIHHQEKLAEYISEARRKGIAVERPSVLYSSALFKVMDGGIRIGLTALKNVGIQTVGALIKERESGHFKNMFDLCARLPGRLMPKRALEALIYAGALDDFNEERSTLIESVDAALHYGEKEREKQTEGQAPLFYEEQAEPEYIKRQPFSLKERLKSEKEILGFYTSGHPAEEDKDILQAYGRKQIFEVKESAGEGAVRVAGMVEGVRTIQTKKKEKMAFLRLSDESGDMEATVFPDAYRTFQTKLQKGEILFIEGKLQTHKGNKKIILEKCIPVDELKRKNEDRLKPVLYLKITRLHEKRGTAEELRTQLGNTPGNVPVVIKYESSGKAVKLTEMWNVDADEDFLLKLKGLLGSQNVFLKKPMV